MYYLLHIECNCLTKEEMNLKQYYTWGDFSMLNISSNNITV